MNLRKGDRIELAEPSGKIGFEDVGRALSQRLLEKPNSQDSIGRGRADERVESLDPVLNRRLRGGVSGREKSVMSKAGNDLGLEGRGGGGGGELVGRIEKRGRQGG